MSRRVEAIHRLLKTGQLSLLGDGRLFEEALREEKAISDWARGMGLKLVPVQEGEKTVGLVLAWDESLPRRLRRELEGLKLIRWLSGVVSHFEPFLELLGLRFPYYPGVKREELEEKLTRLFWEEAEELREALVCMARLAGKAKEKREEGVVWAVSVLREFLEKGVRYGAFYEEDGYIRPMPAYLWLRNLHEERGDRLAAFGTSERGDDEREGEV